MHEIGILLRDVEKFSPLAKMSNCGSVNSLEDKLTTQRFSVYQALPFFVHSCGAISYETSFLSSFSLHHFLVYCHVKMSFLVCGMQDEMEVCLEGQIMLNFANSSNKSWRNNVVISEMPPPYLRDTQVLSPLLFGNPLYFSFQFTKKIFVRIPMSLQALLGQGHNPMPTQTPLGQGHHPQQGLKKVQVRDLDRNWLLLGDAHHLHLPHNLLTSLHLHPLLLAQTPRPLAVW